MESEVDSRRALALYLKAVRTFLRDNAKMAQATERHEAWIAEGRSNLLALSGVDAEGEQAVDAAVAWCTRQLEQARTGLRDRGEQLRMVEQDLMSALAAGADRRLHRIIDVLAYTRGLARGWGDRDTVERLSIDIDDVAELMLAPEVNSAAVAKLLIATVEYEQSYREAHA